MQQSINIADELLYAVSTRKTSRFFRAPYNYCLYRKKKITFTDTDLKPLISETSKC